MKSAVMFARHPSGKEAPHNGRSFIEARAGEEGEGDRLAICYFWPTNAMSVTQAKRHVLDLLLRQGVDNILFRDAHGNLDPVSRAHFIPTHSM